MRGQRSRVILTCTTISSRLDLLFYTLSSISRQSYAPDVVYVNVSREPYMLDEGVADVPSWVSELGATVREVANDGPYRKLLPTISNCEDSDLVITFDDDVLYGRMWLERLVDRATMFPNHIVCGVGRRISRLRGDRFQGYKRWAQVSRTEDGLWLLPIGVGGVAYRRHLLDMEMLTTGEFRRLAPRTDDLWYRVSSLRMLTPVVVDPAISSDDIRLPPPFRLADENTGVGSRSSPSYRKLSAARLTLLARLGVPAVENDFAWNRILSAWPLPTTIPAPSNASAASQDVGK